MKHLINRLVCLIRGHKRDVGTWLGAYRHSKGYYNESFLIYCKRCKAFHEEIIYPEIINNLPTVVIKKPYKGDLWLNQGRFIFLSPLTSEDKLIVKNGKITKEWI